MTSFALIDEDPRYMVDSDGNVYGPKKLLKQRVYKGYCYVKLGTANNLRLVHRLIAQAFLPNPDNKPQVAHWDGDKSNNSLTNLRWATRKENHADRDRHNQWGWKLTAADVREIRRLLVTSDLYQYEIASRFGITQPAVSQIALGKAWKGSE